MYECFAFVYNCTPQVCQRREPGSFTTTRTLNHWANAQFQGVASLALRQILKRGKTGKPCPPLPGSHHTPEHHELVLSCGQSKPTFTRSVEGRGQAGSSQKRTARARVRSRECIGYSRPGLSPGGGARTLPQVSAVTKQEPTARKVPGLLPAQRELPRAEDDRCQI